MSKGFSSLKAEAFLRRLVMSVFSDVMLTRTCIRLFKYQLCSLFVIVHINGKSSVDELPFISGTTETETTIFSHSVGGKSTS